MNAEKKQNIVGNYQLHATDTGSTAVQIALLTHRINHLNTEHLTAFPKDRASRTGLLKLVGKRQKFLRYLKRSQPDQYEHIIAQLGIRK